MATIISDNVPSTNFINPKDDEEWARKLGSLSTLHLKSNLTSLKNKSSTLSSTLTAKLASSSSGHNLLHIGTSLSNLPSNLQSLTRTLEPILNLVEMYRDSNVVELERVLELGIEVKNTLKKIVDGRECMELLVDLRKAELYLKREFCWGACRNKSLIPKEILMDFNKGLSENLGVLSYIGCLERSSQITQNLVHNLELSSSVITSALISCNNENIKTSETEVNDFDADKKQKSIIDAPLPQNTEKAHFIMKLSPRIRKLEKNLLKTLKKNLENILGNRIDHSEFLPIKNTDPIAKVLPCCDETSYRIDEIQGGNVITKKENDLLMLSHLFRSLAYLGKRSEAESIFARVAIMPIIRNKINMEKLDENGTRGECAGLVTLLKDIIYEIRENWGDILNYVEGMFTQNLHDIKADVRIEIDLITAGVWVPIATALTADPVIETAIFSPGIPSILQANYTAIDNFLSQLACTLLKTISDENNCLELTQNDTLNLNRGKVNTFSELYFKPQLTRNVINAAQLRISRHFMTFEFSKKWNLPIYYQLRFCEVTTRMNKAIKRVQEEGWSSDVFTGVVSHFKELRKVTGFEIPLFLEVYDCMLWLWKPHVLLRPLTHRFLRGSIQLIGRFVDFVKNGLEGNIQFGILNNNLNENDMVKKLPLTFSPCQDSRYFWSERIDDVVAVSIDLMILESCINSDYHTFIAKAVVPKQGEKKAMISNTHSELEVLQTMLVKVLSEFSQSISPIISKAWNEVIANFLIKKCSGPLCAVKGVAASYRMTNRPPPSQASSFVATILQPLKDFNDKFSAKIPPQVDSKWKYEVIIAVGKKYSDAVAELNDMLHRTEEALKSRKSRRVLTSGMSDGDKVKLQLYLDQREFVRDIKTMGINTTNITAIKTLIELTQNAESLYFQAQNI